MQAAAETGHQAAVSEVVFAGRLAAGRCFSSAHDANDHANLIPHCVALGEAAGAAAALALQSNTTFRNVDVKKVQQMLKKQGVYLPR